MPAGIVGAEVDVALEEWLRFHLELPRVAAPDDATRQRRRAGAGRMGGGATLDSSACAWLGLSRTRCVSGRVGMAPSLPFPASFALSSSETPPLLRSNRFVRRPHQLQQRLLEGSAAARDQSVLGLCR